MTTTPVPGALSVRCERHGFEVSRQGETFTLAKGSFKRTELTQEMVETLLDIYQLGQWDDVR